MIDEKIVSKGKVGTTKSGKDIPQEIIRTERGRPCQDKIKIRGDKESFYLYVSEEFDGKMAKALDILASEEGLKVFPSVGYDNALEADIYKVNLTQLARLLDLYTGGQSSTPISEAQRRARQANMDTALRQKAENQEQKRKQRLKGK